MEIKKVVFSLIILSLFQIGLQGQVFSYLTNGAGSVGSANTVGASISNYSALNNQAGIINPTKKWGFTASAGTLYGFKSLLAGSASFRKNFRKNQAFSVAFKYFGDSELNQSLVGIAYARKLLPNWSVAIQGDFISYLAQGFGSKYTGTIEIGSVFQPNNALSVGFHAFNPISTKLTENQAIPTILRLALQYKISEKVQLQTEVQKIWDSNFSINVGTEYQVAEMLDLRFGFASKNKQLFAGLAFNFGGSSIQSAFTWHNTLGYTPVVGYAFEK